MFLVANTTRIGKTKLTTLEVLKRDPTNADFNVQATFNVLLATRSYVPSANNHARRFGLHWAASGLKRVSSRWNRLK